MSIDEDKNAKKVCIITGGAQGIGKAMGKAYLEQGWSVVIADVNVQAGQEITEDFSDFDGDDVLFSECDVSNEKSVLNMIDQTIEKFGRIDCLINNAGIFEQRNIMEITLEQWNRVISVNSNHKG